MAYQASVDFDYESNDLNRIAQKMTEGVPPIQIEFKKEGKFFTVLKRTWS